MIKYITITFQMHGVIFKSIQFKYVVYIESWGQIHLYLTVFKYLYKNLYLMFGN